VHAGDRKTTSKYPSWKRGHLFPPQGMHPFNPIILYLQYPLNIKPAGSIYVRESYEFQCLLNEYNNWSMHCEHMYNKSVRLLLSIVILPAYCLSITYFPAKKLVTIFVPVSELQSENVSGNSLLSSDFFKMFPINSAARVFYLELLCLSYFLIVCLHFWLIYIQAYTRTLWY
jgi:hypothetical protein